MTRVLEDGALMDETMALARQLASGTTVQLAAVEIPPTLR